MAEVNVLLREKPSPTEPVVQEPLRAPAREQYQEREAPAPTQSNNNHDHLTPKRTWRFWAVFPALCVTTFLSALDTSILSTALPTIALDIDAGELYMWITNSYILSSTVVLPLFGQMANIFGRRRMLIISVVIFTLGSGMAGGAKNTGLLIAGRTIQGIGGGGINTLVDIVICDLVPLRQRGKYVALMAAVWAVGTVIGPVLGGAFAQYVSWRWVFYINLPLCAASLLLLVLFLRVTHPRTGGTVWHQLKRVDLVGNSILTAAVISILLALTWAGTTYAWSSWRVIVPLILGLGGLFLFYGHQTSRFCTEPSIPLRLFSSRTGMCALWIAFLQSILLYWVGYFLPVYFQAIRNSTATESGLYVLPITAAIAPFGIITGVIIAMTGKYRIFHFLGYIFLTIASGLFSLLDDHSPARDWAGFQILFGAGSGMIFSSTLPPIQASLSESDVATATSTWAFMRSFGCIWGIVIPTTIFNARVQELLYRVSDVSLRAKLADGGAYAMASQGLMRTLSNTPNLRAEVLSVYQDSLRWVWWISIPFGGVGLLLCIPIKELELTEELNTEFGLHCATIDREEE
ncbi:Major facilitator superfamily domain general substrate transporter [Penicillium concentricum]|uniref:Major facilitator superfamily domain general substrate transporter n=1 Tax=Penicillium concentricum TaxID=293559 RepID=A0A9W9V3X8_9EURO|nr:Major facilitator superfamily domain general substrate transporter [Penicillium concentricum]KAJ5365620.1 Major facilitator superfamily domain general substrate transporter [Penicillium concentricum]